MKIRHLIIYPVLLIFLASCAGTTLSESEKAEKKLHDRVVRLWEARKNKEWETVYEMSAHAYRKKTPKKKFLYRGHVDILDYKIDGITINPDGRSALVSTSFTLRKNTFTLEMSVKDRWLLENNQWYIQLGQKRTPFGNRP